MKKLTAFVAVVVLAALTTGKAEAAGRVRGHGATAARTAGSDLLSDTREPVVVTRGAGLVALATLAPETSVPATARAIQFQALTLDGASDAAGTTASDAVVTRRNLVAATYGETGERIIVHLDGSQD